MRRLRFLFALLICLSAGLAYAEDGLWLFEQEFVKFGKKDAYEAMKKDQQRGFFKKVGFPRFCIEGSEGSQFIYLIPLKDFKGLSDLMQKRRQYNQELTDKDEKLVLPFLSTINFFIESLHHHLTECSFVLRERPSLMDYTAVHYADFAVTPGNSLIFEKHLSRIAESQAMSSKPVCFRTWRVLFGGDVPSYIIAVFADSIQEAKEAMRSLELTEGQIKNILRQEKKGSAVIRKDLSSFSMR